MCLCGKKGNIQVENEPGNRLEIVESSKQIPVR